MAALPTGLGAGALVMGREVTPSNAGVLATGAAYETYPTAMIVCPPMYQRRVDFRWWPCRAGRMADTACACTPLSGLGGNVVSRLAKLSENSCQINALMRVLRTKKRPPYR